MNLKRFIVFFAVALGALTACVDDLAEPNDVNNLLSGVEAQMEAMQKSAEDMKALNESLGEYDVNINEAEESISQHLASLKKGVSRETATLAALEQQKKIAAVMGAVEGAVLANEGYAKGLKKQFEDVNAGIAMWLGESFAAFYQVAVAQAKVDFVLTDLNPQIEDQQLYVSALLSDVEAGLREDKNPAELVALAASVEKMSQTSEALASGLSSIAEELEAEYKSSIKTMCSDPAAFNNETLVELNAEARTKADAATPSLTALAAEVVNCKNKLAELEERLGVVEADVEELLGMIQSVTFMSDYSTEYAYAYYDMNLDAKVSDSNLPYNGKAQRTATGEMNLTYMVRPAAAASALNANTDAVKVNGYYASTIETKAPLATDCFDLEVKKVALVNETRGLVTVTVEPRLREGFYYKTIGAKCALSIQTGKTDVTSKFVEILPKENSNRVYVESVTASKQEIYMKKGEYTTLTATVSPENVTSPGYDLSTFDTQIIRINEETGEIYAYGVGTAKVIVTSKGTDEWGERVSTTCTVNVEEAFMLSGPPYVEVGNTTQIFLSYPTDAVINEKIWKSSDESKLTVDTEGKVTGVAHTYNTVTKEYNDVTVSCTINGVTTVSWNLKVAAVQPKKIITNGLSDNQGEVTVRVNESLSLASTIYPDNVPAGAYKIKYQSDQALGWINFDTGVIDAGRNSYATTSWVTITVDNHDQEKYYVSDGRVSRVIIVKVIPYYVKTITLSDVEIEIGQAAVTLSPTFTSDVSGKAPTNTAVTWTSNNEAVATVDQNGKVTPVAPGNATITATAKDGSNVSGSCQVSVTQPWKEFNVGDYVVRNPYTKEIEFYSSKPSSNVVGIVIAKTNPRATDPMLPESCTHGIAIALGEGEGNWSSNDSQKVSDWAAQSGQAFVADVNVYSGYTNTQALKAFISANGASSGIISALNTYNLNEPGLPNGVSTYYIPSAAAMKDIANLSGGTMDFSNKLTGIGGVALSNMDSNRNVYYYWTVSEAQYTTSQAVAIRGLMYQSTNKSKTSSSKVRYVFAF